MALLAAGSAVVPCARTAGADDGGHDVVSDADVRKALEVFGKAVRSREAGERIVAVRDLGVLVHEKVAARLVRLVKTEDDHEVLGVVFESLRRQRPFAEKIVPGLAARLESEAEEAAERLVKGDAGFRIDPRTGDADTSSPEGRRLLQETRQRAVAFVCLIGTLDALGWQPKGRLPDLTAFLQDPHDDLVVAVLGKLQAWKDRSCLAAVLDLYRMYPTESSWETGAVIDLAGTNATAKAKWMVRFGHPEKQRARPEVARAIRRALRCGIRRSRRPFSRGCSLAPTIRQTPTGVPRAESDPTFLPRAAGRACSPGRARTRRGG
jgi:hypothetical protein